ncbi:cell division protein ZapE [Aureimonas altamirensis]|uniref:cell division protein ZapE n=1 Tax=Aureimonas altamirensis TaxID=370622 RepID=UPI0006916A3A|nr:cell division protein ZapE [Aureimonas altamirensis]
MPQNVGYGVPGSERGPVRTELERRIRDATITPDDIQRRLADRLDVLARAIKSRALSSKKSALGWLFGRSRPEPVKGLYIYGQVGRGKSMMMDMFYDTVSGMPKRRVHFHAFMSEVQDRIKAHRQSVKDGLAKGDDPIPPVAEAIAREAQLLCFDEFTVTDIADAMILARLFTALFDAGVILVATSNVAPDDLYRDGLNRSLFLPFIDILKRNAEMFELDAPQDYRMTKLGGDELYVTPLGPEADQAIDAIWTRILAGTPERATSLSVTGRTIDVPRAGNRAARFSFADLMERPLGPRDYLEMAENFDTIVIEGVPRLTRSERNAAKRFIILVDAFYDAGKDVVLSAAVAAEDLYEAKGGTEAFEFARTVSRLTEMRSEDYRAHAGAAARRRMAP